MNSRELTTESTDISVEVIVLDWLTERVLLRYKTKNISFSVFVNSLQLVTSILILKCISFENVEQEFNLNVNPIAKRKSMSCSS